MKNKNRITLTIAFFAALAVVCQVVPPPIPPPPPPGLPIDGGLMFLIVSGALYGAYKLKR